MIQDLHSHTKYSFCSKDLTVEDGVLAAKKGGIRLFGICDHNYGIGFGDYDEFIKRSALPTKVYQERLLDYYWEISKLKDKYRGEMEILSGVEIATSSSKPKHLLPKDADVSFFDYRLIEHIDYEDSVVDGDLFSYASRCRGLIGVAHTDMFRFIEKIGENPLDYFKRMADENIFWELNVNFDSAHGFLEHQYVKDFFKDERKQEIVRKSGVKLSVGFDGHKADEYDPKRVIDANLRLRDLNIPLVFDGAIQTVD